MRNDALRSRLDAILTRTLAAKVRAQVLAEGPFTDDEIAAAVARHPELSRPESRITVHALIKKDVPGAIREMLAEILRIDPAYKIVGESGDGQQACQLCLDLKPDLLVLDARLPGLSGVDILRRISKQLKNTRVLIFSAYESPALVREIVRD